ncbi:protein lplB [Clostridia bacterium]|nr:protein lplB [Clostridia bacterium]
MTTVVRNGISQSPKARQRSEAHRLMRKYAPLYPLLAFGLAYFAVFNYAPLYGLQLAFKNYKIKGGIWGSPWVGWNNFHTMFIRNDFWQAFTNTIVLSLLRIIISFPVPIILAITLTDMKNRRLSRGLQIVYSLPHFLSWVTVGGILTHLLASSGAVNSLLKSLGLAQVGFLSSGGIFRGLVVVSNIWKEGGWTSIIYLAAIAAIDPALYESASLDGATRFQRAWHITIPSIRPTAAVMLILALGGAMSQGFDQIFNLYNPTVFSVADIIDTYIYRITFQRAPNYGVSTAVGMFKGVCNAVLLLAANWVVARLDPDSRML